MWNSPGKRVWNPELKLETLKHKTEIEDRRETPLKFLKASY